MSNGPILDHDTPRHELTKPERPERNSPNTATLKRLFVVILAGGLGGCAVFDGIRMLTTYDRKVHFWVVDGEVDENSVRINGFFSIPDGPLTEEQKKLQRLWFPIAKGREYKDGEVFSFPHDEPDPTTCVYKFGGGYSEKYTFPPDTATKPGPPPLPLTVPPCPPYATIN